MGIEVNSFAGSGTAVFSDFAEAVYWFWGNLLGDCRIDSDEQAAPEERVGRQRFHALIARFESDGYTRDMEDELREIVDDIQGDAEGIPGYVVGNISILGDDPDVVLSDWWGDPGADDYFAELAAEGKPTPDFDFANPEHMAALERRVEWLTQV